MTARSTLLNAARDTDEDVAWKLITQHARGIITPAELDYKLAELIFGAKPIDQHEQYVQDALTSAYTKYAESLRAVAEQQHYGLPIRDPEEPFLTGVWPIPQMPTFDVSETWMRCRNEAKGHKGGQLIEASRLFWLAVEQYADDTSSWSLKVLKSMNDLKSHVVEVRTAIERSESTKPVK